MRAAVLTAAASLLVLSACGNGADDTDADTDTNGAAEEVTEDDGDDADDADSTDGAGEDPDTLVLGLGPSQDMDKLVEDADMLGDLLSEELGIEVEAAGRAYATYGGVYIAASLFWLWAFEGMRPDRWDLTGAAICLVGAGVILFGPRPA